ncbi:PREDICTED: ervatamin-B-like [Lupinus angustifolius]|uniref:ervatamin-B-like n=1 Tax=Lupinus angustifolius TaxID=3871 RepID=UPI00092F54A0|nr:PREDICTED: ervatamin-B-like [Lupinus angustifolius]XP_019455100.1 PREDICTED: ervatamin-B-like [Lupinus angustifolius]
MAKKFMIFISNLNYIIESNARRNSHSSHILGLNKFSDWSSEEFKETYLNHQEMLTDSGMPTENDIELNDLSYISVPSSLDWRTKGAVTAVKNQESTCGCCWAFSAVGTIEGINAIVTKNLISLSEQELVDCDSASQGCITGKVTNALNWVIKNGGIASDVVYPYKAQQGTCQASKVGNIATITSFAKVAQSDAALLSATAIQPISVSVDATDMKQYTKDSGIFDGRNCKNTTDVNHSMLIVGYDRSKEGVDYWIVKNSWGKDWGKDGYIWIKRNTNLPYGVCAVNAWAYNPIKS